MGNTGVELEDELNKILRFYDNLIDKLMIGEQPTKEETAIICDLIFDDDNDFDYPWTSNGIRFEQLEYRFSDTELELNDPNGIPTDKDRLEYAHDLIFNELVDNPDADTVPGFGLIPFYGTKKRSAYFGLSVSEYSFSEITQVFEGVFNDIESFKSYLRESDYILSDDIPSKEAVGSFVSDIQIL